MHVNWNIFVTCIDICHLQLTVHLKIATWVTSGKWLPWPKTEIALTSQAALHSNYTARKVVTVGQHESHASLSSILKEDILRENDSSFCRPLQFAVWAEVSLAAVFRDVMQRFPKGGSVAWHPERRLRRRLLEQHISVYVLRKWLKFVRWRWRDVSEFIFVYLYHFRHKCVYCNPITVWFFALPQWLLAKQQETNCYNNPLMHSLVSPPCHHLRNQWPMRQRSSTVSPCVWAQWFDGVDLIYSSPTREVNFFDTKFTPIHEEGLLWLPREDLNAELFPCVSDRLNSLISVLFNDV